MGETKYFTDFSIISLGDRCWSRVLWDSFSLVNMENRRVRMPFDGCVTTYKSLISLLDNDFANVLNGLKKEGDEILTEFQRFPHERPPGRDFKNFKEQTHLRIKQFYDEINFHIREKKTLVFFLKYKKYPNELINIIKNKFPKLKFKIFCISTQKYQTEKKQESIDDYFCRLLEMKMPSMCGGNMVELRKTTDGQMFEKNVLAELLMFLTNLGGVEYNLNEIFSARIVD